MSLVIEVTPEDIAEATEIHEHLTKTSEDLGTQINVTEEEEDDDEGFPPPPDFYIAECLRMDALQKQADVLFHQYWHDHESTYDEIKSKVASKIGLDNELYKLTVAVILARVFNETKQVDWTIYPFNICVH